MLEKDECPIYRQTHNSCIEEPCWFHMTHYVETEHVIQYYRYEVTRLWAQVIFPYRLFFFSTTCSISVRGATLSQQNWMNVNKLCQALTKLNSRKCWGGKKKLILFIVTFLWRYEPRASGGFHESLSFLCIRVIVIVKGKEIKYFVLVNKGVLCPAPSMLRSVADF